MAMEKGKDRPDPITNQPDAVSRDADPRNVEKSAVQSGDNDGDRIITQPEAKKATDDAYLKNTQGGGNSESREVKES